MLDRVDQFPDFGLRRNNYALTLTGDELSDTERNAAGSAPPTARADDVNLDLDLP